MTKSEIRKKLKQFYQAPSIKLPDNIDFINPDDETYIIRLKSSDIINKNMQVDSCAFEGWAIFLYGMLVSTGYNRVRIVLDTDEELQLEAGVPCGHLNRFLYRALKFSEQYKWFSLSDDLGAKVTQFKAYLESGFFTNNIGRNAAGTKRKAESIQEARFSNAGILKNTLPPDIAFGSNEVHRQLSVGLFEGQRAARGKNVFTGGTSAIDLWSWNGDTLEIIELKAGQKKVGIITEIFFYCNYMRDLALPDGTFQLCKEIPKNKDTRGYEDLLSNKFSRVLGILLADAFHPCLGDTAIRIMNSNAGAPIQYYMAKYSAE